MSLKGHSFGALAHGLREVNLLSPWLTTVSTGIKVKVVFIKFLYFFSILLREPYIPIYT